MIYIIRHGQTHLNKSQVLQGRSDHPLNEEGIRQAGEAAEWFRSQGIRFSHVFSSPLKRALQTAEIAAGGAPVTVDERLIEMDYGPYEGMDLRSPAPEIITFFSDFINQPAPEGMEQLSEVVRRSGELMEDIRGMEGDILISTHAIAMKGILEYLTPESKGSYWNKYVGNCAVYAAASTGGRFGIPEEVFSLQ